MNTIDEIKFLLRYYEKINFDKTKMVSKIKELIENKSISKKSIDVIIISCELRVLYDELDNNLVSNLKKEKAQSKSALHKMTDDFPFTIQPTITIHKSHSNIDPCSSSTSGGYSGKSRGGC